MDTWPLIALEREHVLARCCQLVREKGGADFVARLEARLGPVYVCDMPLAGNDSDPEDDAQMTRGTKRARSAGDDNDAPPEKIQAVIEDAESALGPAPGSWDSLVGDVKMEILSKLGALAAVDAASREALRLLARVSHELERDVARTEGAFFTLPRFDRLLDAARTNSPSLFIFELAEAGPNSGSLTNLSTIQIEHLALAIQSNAVHRILQYIVDTALPVAEALRRGSNFYNIFVTAYAAHELHFAFNTPTLDWMQTPRFQALRWLEEQTNTLHRLLPSRSAGLSTARIIDGLLMYTRVNDGQSFLPWSDRDIPDARIRVSRAMLEWFASCHGRVDLSIFAAIELDDPAVVDLLFDQLIHPTNLTGLLSRVALTNAARGFASDGAALGRFLAHIPWDTINQPGDLLFHLFLRALGTRFSPQMADAMLPFALDLITRVRGFDFGAQARILGFWARQFSSDQRVAPMMMAYLKLMKHMILGRYDDIGNNRFQKFLAALNPSATHPFTQDDDGMLANFIQSVRTDLRPLTVTERNSWLQTLQRITGETQQMQAAIVRYL